MSKIKTKMCNLQKHICTQDICANIFIMLCAIENNRLSNTWNNKNTSKTVQNSVSFYAIREQNICAILIKYINMQKCVQIFIKKSAILAMLTTQTSYCRVLHIFVQQQQNCRQYWNDLVCRCNLSGTVSVTTLLSD